MNANRGFTIVESLVVVAIITLLLAILCPCLREAKEQAKEVVSVSDMRQAKFAKFINGDDTVLSDLSDIYSCFGSQSKSVVQSIPIEEETTVSSAISTSAVIPLPGPPEPPREGPPLIPLPEIIPSPRQEKNREVRGGGGAREREEREERGREEESERERAIRERDERIKERDENARREKEEGERGREESGGREGSGGEDREVR